MLKVMGFRLQEYAYKEPAQLPTRQRWYQLESLAGPGLTHYKSKGLRLEGQARNMAWLAESLPGMHAPLVRSPAPHKLGVMSHTYNPSTQGMEAGGSEVQTPSSATQRV